jgi:uncharacterized repeat protein (TIGR01451 family)
MSALRSFRSGRLRRVRSFAVFTVLVVAGLLWIGSAQAVHDNGMFELDGNVVQSGTAPPYDWSGLFDAAGNSKVTLDPINGPVLASAFVNDTDSVDTTYFAGGTKIDDQVHNMACGGPAANDKTSMDFVYTALIQVPNTAPDNAGHQVLYFGIEKQAAGNGGDNAFGFWLFKNKNVGCSGSGSFTGAHTDGDLFIDGLFTNGGGTSDVQVFRWNGDDTTGSIGSTPIFTGNVCGAVSGNDNVCAIANDSSITAGAWRAPATTMAANTFVEAGIDMTALLGQGGGCFTTFLADSQSSQDTNSQPKDYAGGQMNTCVPPPIDTTATPGGSTVPVGDTNQYDLATISAVGGHPSPTGTMSFFLCNPSEVTSGGCETGGTQVGGAVTIANGSAQSDTADGALLATAGTYCWRAEYTPDADGNKFYSASSHTNHGSECFTVVKNTTSIGTAATSGTIGDALHDVATLSGATAGAGGTITFNLYGPSDSPDCSGNPVFTKTVNVDGPGDYTSGDFTPTAAGKYYWVASYSGDDNNKASTGTCGDEGETSTIGKKTTSIGTAATSGTIGDSISDTATLSGATGDAGGTITFNLYGPSDTPACSGEPVYTNTVDVNGPGDYNSGDFTPDTAGSYYWVASYSGDPNNLSSTGSCGDEGETSTIDKATPSIVTSATSGSLGDAIHDVATLSGGANVPQGTITFNLYGPNDPSCDGEPVFTDTVSVDGNGDYQSADFTPDTQGTYYWVASYSGDVNNESATGSCGDDGETSIVQSPEIHILKTPDAAKVNAGSPIGFTMTVYNAGGGDAHGVTLTDKLPTNAGLSWTIASQGSGWDGSCKIAAGTLTCGPVLVPGNTTQAASSFTVHITSPTTGATGGDCPGSGTVNNTGDVTTTNDGSDEATASTCVQALVDLSITKTGSPAVQKGFGNITWTIVVTNNGPSADTNVQITDPIPAGNTFVSATSTQGTCTGGTILHCNIGNMAAGASVTITLVTTPSTQGNQVNTATVTGGRAETNTANNTASATVVVNVETPPVVYCVAVSKVTPNQLFVGRKTTLTIHVTQHGKAKAGVHVLIRGPHFLKRTKASNAKGVIKQTVKMKKAGALIFTPIASKRCNTKRIGVTGVFTPPVTG